MQNRVGAGSPFKQPFLNLAYNILVTYKYLFIASVLCFLAGAYFYQNNRISGYRANVVLEITDKNESQAAAHSFVKELKSLSLPPSFQAYSRGGNKLIILPGSTPQTLSIQINSKSSTRTQIVLDSLISYYNQLLSSHSLVRVDSNSINNKIRELTGRIAKLGIVPPTPQYLPSRAKRSRYLITENEDSVKKAKVLDVVLSYIGKPLNSFVLIPESFVSFDSVLEDWVIEFNELQAYRQSILSDEEPDDAELRKTNQRVLTIANLIKQYASRQKSAGVNYVRIQIKNKVIAPNKKQVLQQAKVATDEVRLLTDSIKNFEARLHVMPIPATLSIAKKSYEFTPVRSHSPLLYLGAAFLGLLIPALGLFAYKLASTKISTPADLNALTHIEIAGVLNNAPAGNLNPPYSNSSFGSIARFFKSRLNNAHAIFWITSGSSGEGKQNTVTGLAEAFAGIGNSVLVIDYSLDSPDLLEDLELNYHLGLQEYLSRDDISVDNLLNSSVSYKRIDFIGAGVVREQLKMEMLTMLSQLDIPMVAEQSPELTESKVYEKFGRLLKHSKKLYDYVFVSGPSINENPDLFKVSKHADVSICMVKLNYTRKTQIAQFNELLNAGELINPFIVVDNLPPTAESSIVAYNNEQ
jgi:Mrp family chromosome partitioning ATPase